MRDIKGFLRGRGIAPSFHRVKILEYLLSCKSHPTVDMIYRELVREIPTLSKTTVYNTLELFYRRGVVLRFSIDGKKMRYDGDTTPHSHFVCEVCGKVYDVRLDAVPVVPKEKVDGHLVKGCDVFFRGVCRECLKKTT